MSLLVCKKCKKLITSNVEPCPYCGEVNEVGPRRDLSPKIVSLRNAGIGFFLLAVLLILFFQLTTSGTRTIQAPAANASAASTVPLKMSCQSTECPTGTRAVTNTSPQDPFYLCKTDGLSEYANFVLNLMLKQDRYAEIVPSTRFSELTVPDNEKALLEKYKAKAGVASFEDAISKCYRGLGDVNVVVLYSPTDSSSIYVAAADNQDNKFWMPKARLFPQ
jgi:hypothetical protein